MDVARAFVRGMDYDLPLVVDRMDDAAMRAYAGWPERLYVVDEANRIAYRGGLGPFLFNPNQLEAWLEEHVGDASETRPRRLRGSP